MGLLPIIRLGNEVIWDRSIYLKLLDVRSIVSTTGRSLKDIFYSLFVLKEMESSLGSEVNVSDSI